MKHWKVVDAKTHKVLVINTYPYCYRYVRDLYYTKKIKQFVKTPNTFEITKN